MEIELTPTYLAGPIVLAYLVAIVGAWTTIELLLRRTPGAGRLNSLLLVAAGMAFGSTATFGMHFVGNQAVRLEYPDPTAVADLSPLHLSYNIGFTLLSLVVSCLSMIPAFSFIGLRTNRLASWARQTEDEKAESTVLEIEDVDDLETQYPHVDETDEGEEGEFGANPARVSTGGILRILGAGVICGGGIAAMHYIGQYSINSVSHVTNTAYLVVLSVLIAIVAVSLGLYLLFVVLRPKLDHRWYKRGGVAMLLALGTSLMHFVGLLGTHYWVVKGSLVKPGSGASSRILILALVLVLTPLCCLVSLLVAVVTQAQVVRSMLARHRVVVAVVLFDAQGLILVQPNGLLPSAEISPPSILPSDREEGAAARRSVPWWSPNAFWAPLFFGNRLTLHATNTKLARDDPAFIAFLRASWSWRSTVPKPTAAPVVRLGGTGWSKSEVNMANAAEEAIADAVESFEQAAMDISARLSGAAEQTKVNGVLYDGILKTGHFQVANKTSGDTFTVTQGQMLVLSRRIKSTSERQSFVDRGFTFAQAGQAARVTAQTLAVPPARVMDFFRDVYCFSRFGVVRRVEPGRVYVGVFVIQAVPGSGLQIVVDRKQHHSIPMVEFGCLSSTSFDRPASAPAPASPLPRLDLSSVAQSTNLFGGHTLEQLLVAAAQSSPTLASTSSTPPLRSLILASVLPLLDRNFPPDLVADLRNHLSVVPTLIPLLDRPISTPTAPRAGGVRDESFLICLRAVIPASLEMPGRLNWIPFSLYKAQAECVDSDRRLVKAASLAAGEPPGGGTASGSTATGSSHGGGSVGGKCEETEGPLGGRRRAPPPPPVVSFPPTRPVLIPPYDPDWVVGLVRPTLPVQAQAQWDWVESARSKGLRRRKTDDDE